MKLKLKVYKKVSNNLNNNSSYKYSFYNYKKNNFDTKKWQTFYNDFEDIIDNELITDYNNFNYKGFIIKLYIKDNSLKLKIMSSQLWLIEFPFKLHNGCFHKKNDNFLIYDIDNYNESNGDIVTITLSLNYWYSYNCMVNFRNNVFIKRMTNTNTVNIDGKYYYNILFNNDNELCNSLVCDMIKPVLKERKEEDIVESDNVTWNNNPMIVSCDTNQNYRIGKKIIGYNDKKILEKLIKDSEDFILKFDKNIIDFLDSNTFKTICYLDKSNHKWLNDKSNLKFQLDNTKNRYSKRTIVRGLIWLPKGRETHFYNLPIGKKLYEIILKDKKAYWIINNICLEYLINNIELGNNFIGYAKVVNWYTTSEGQIKAQESEPFAVLNKLYYGGLLFDRWDFKNWLRQDFNKGEYSELKYNNLKKNNESINLFDFNITQNDFYKRLKNLLYPYYSYRYNYWNNIYQLYDNDMNYSNRNDFFELRKNNSGINRFFLIKKWKDYSIDYIYYSTRYNIRNTSFYSYKDSINTFIRNETTFETYINLLKIILKNNYIKNNYKNDIYNSLKNFYKLYIKQTYSENESKLLNITNFNFFNPKNKKDMELFYVLNGLIENFYNKPNDIAKFGTVNKIKVYPEKILSSYIFPISFNKSIQYTSITNYSKTFYNKNHLEYKKIIKIDINKYLVNITKYESKHRFINHLHYEYSYSKFLHETINNSYILENKGKMIELKFRILNRNYSLNTISLYKNKKIGIEKTHNIVTLLPTFANNQNDFLKQSGVSFMLENKKHIENMNLKVKQFNQSFELKKAQQYTQATTGAISNIFSGNWSSLFSDSVNFGFQRMSENIKKEQFKQKININRRHFQETRKARLQDLENQGNQVIQLNNSYLDALLYQYQPKINYITLEPKDTDIKELNKHFLLYGTFLNREIKDGDKFLYHREIFDYIQTQGDSVLLDIKKSKFCIHKNEILEFFNYMYNQGIFFIHSDIEEIKDNHIFSNYDIKTKIKKYSYKNEVLSKWNNDYDSYEKN